MNSSQPVLMNYGELEKLRRQTVIERYFKNSKLILNDYMPHKPTKKQTLALTLNADESLYGGAAGGGKSDYLLMAALQYVDVPGYAAILFRRTYADLSLPGALMDRAGEWLRPTNARWSEQKKTWHFPTDGEDATVTFGYLENEKDKYRYQSAEFQYIGFDELTQFSETQYRYLFSRRRRLAGSEVPLRTRSASNPGGFGHEWVKRTFVDDKYWENGKPFIPAKLSDNQHIDREEYVKSLMHLDPVTREQLLNGDWTVRPEGMKFRRQWFDIVEEPPAIMRKVRYWDMAATEPKEGTEPDYTAGCLLGITPDNVIYLLDMKRFRETPLNNEKIIKQTAQMDGKNVTIMMEQEPGSSGVNSIDQYRRRVLMGWEFRGVRSTGSKEVRANPVSSQAEAGNIKLVNGRWISDFLDEAESFPAGVHDDQIDAMSGAFNYLVGGAGGHLQIG